MALSSTLDLDEVFDRILANIGRVVPMDTADVMTLDSTGEIVHVVRSIGYEKFAESHITLDQHVTFTLARTHNLHHVALTHQPLNIADVLNYPEWVALRTTFATWRTTIGAGPVSYTHLTLPTSDLV